MAETDLDRHNPFGIMIDEAFLKRMESYFDNLTIRGKWWLPRLSFGKYLLKNKLSKAESVYAKLEPGEKPVALFINTHFGSAKKGFVFTDKNLYYKLWLAGHSKILSGKIPFAKILKIHFDNAEINGIKLPHIYINNKPFGMVDHMIKAEMDVLNNFFETMDRSVQKQSVSPVWAGDGEEVIHTLHEGIYGFGWTVTRVYITNSRVVALPSEMVSLKNYMIHNPDSYFNCYNLADIQSFALSKPPIHMDFINKSKLIVNFTDGNKVLCKGPLVNLVELREWIEIARNSYIPLLKFSDSDEQILFKDGIRKYYQLFQHYFDILNYKTGIKEKVSSKLGITTKRLIFYRIEGFSGLSHREYNWQISKDTWKVNYRKPGLLLVYIPFEEVERIKIIKGKILGSSVKIKLKEGLPRGLTVDGTTIPTLADKQYPGIRNLMVCVNNGEVDIPLDEVNTSNSRYLEKLIEALRKVTPDKVIVE